jgi:hypothetical protein
VKSKNALRLVAGGVLVVGSGGAGGLLAPAGAEDTSTPTTDPSTTSTTEAALSPSSFVPLANYSVLNTNDAGAGSLRQAVLDANANAGADTITFDPSVTGTITLTSGQINITDSVTITGPGSANLAISGNDASRIFDAATSGTDVSISGLSFVHGSGPAWNGQWSDWGATGGAIRVVGASITLDQVSMSDNATNRLGGGLGTRNAASVTVTDSTFTSNTAAAGGGAMSFYGGGAVTLDRVTVTGNTNTGDNAGARVTYNYGGGGVRVAGTSSTTITGSTFSSNAVVNTGVQSGIGGGVYVGAWSGPALIEGVTIDSNTSDRHGSGFAGFGSITIANSTITGNSNTAAPGTYGGAVHLAGLWGGTTSSKILQTTITGNTSNGDNPSGLVVLNRSGRSTDLSVSLYGTVIAGNIGGPDVGFPDNWGPSGNQVVPATTDFMINSSNSVLGSIRATTPFTDGSGNQLDVTDPMLAPLANNGGPTKTMLPLAGSPLINAGGSTVPTFPGNAYDQRGAGFARLVGSALDVGAFEVQAPTLTGVAPATGSAAGGTTITMTGTNFTAGMTVTVGGVACTDVTVLSATSATCVTPVGTAGAADVVVDVSGLTATLPASFTYEEPAPTTTTTAAGDDPVVPAFTG